MDGERNKAIVHRFVKEILVGENLELLEEIIHNEYQPHYAKSLFFENQEISLTKRGLKDRFESWVKSFNFELIEMHTIGEGNTVLALLLAKVTQIGKWNQLETKNQSTVSDSVRWFTFKDGLILSMTVYSDYIKFWGDLGHESILGPGDSHSDNDYLKSAQKLRLNF